MDETAIFYLNAWNELVTERPVIATMASVSYGSIPRSKIKSYAEDDLGLIGEEVDLFIAVMRRVESKSRAAMAETTKQAATTDPSPDGRRGARASKPFKKPRVRHPRS